MKAGELCHRASWPGVSAGSRQPQFRALLQTVLCARHTPRSPRRAVNHERAPAAARPEWTVGSAHGDAQRVAQPAVAAGGAATAAGGPSRGCRSGRPPTPRRRPAHRPKPAPTQLAATTAVADAADAAPRRGSQVAQGGAPQVRGRAWERRDRVPSPAPAGQAEGQQPARRLAPAPASSCGSWARAAASPAPTPALLPQQRVCARSDGAAAAAHGLLTARDGAAQVRGEAIGGATAACKTAACLQPLPATPC